MSETSERTGIGERLACGAGYTALIPLKAMAWVGNKLTGSFYGKMDRLPVGRRNLGEVFKRHANKILVPLSYCGDAGYVGYAIEQCGKAFYPSAQIVGALSTLPVNTVLFLIGDENPPLQKIAARMPPSAIGNAFRALANSVVKNRKYIVPASWIALSLNGLSMAAAAATKSVDIGHIAHAATPYLPQLADLLLRFPEFTQGTAIFAGTTALAVNQYVQLSQTTDVDGLAEKTGNLATGILSFCTAMTGVTALVDQSPSLGASAIAFFALNYCQYRLSRTAPTVQ